MFVIHEASCKRECERRRVNSSSRKSRLSWKRGFSLYVLKVITFMWQTVFTVFSSKMPQMKQDNIIIFITTTELDSKSCTMNLISLRQYRISLFHISTLPSTLCSSFFPKKRHFLLQRGLCFSNSADQTFSFVQWTHKSPLPCCFHKQIWVKHPKCSLRGTTKAFMIPQWTRVSLTVASLRCACVCVCVILSAGRWNKPEACGH